MSKQLAISASGSIFAMMALTVLTTQGNEFAPANGLMQKGAAVEAAAPSFDRIAPALIDFLR